MDAYEIEKEIGKGSYGVVCLCTDRRDGKKYVMKKVKLDGMPQKEREAS